MDVSDALVSGRSLSVVRDRAPQRFMEQDIRNFRVFKVYHQDRVLLRFVEQNFKVHLLLRFVEQNFKIFPQDRAPQRFVEQNKILLLIHARTGRHSVWWSRTSSSSWLSPRTLLSSVWWSTVRLSPGTGLHSVWFLPGSSSTVFYGEEHHGFLPGSSSTAFGGAQHLHHLLPPLSSVGGSSVVDGAAEFRPMRFCTFFSSGTCFKGNECTFAHAWEELS